MSQHVCIYRYESRTFVNGVANFTLKDGETKEASELPVEIGYVVTEDDYTSEGYTTTVSNGKGMIADGETQHVLVTNTKDKTFIFACISVFVITCRME